MCEINLNRTYDIQKIRPKSVFNILSKLLKNSVSVYVEVIRNTFQQTMKFGQNIPKHVHLFLIVCLLNLDHPHFKSRQCSFYDGSLHRDYRRSRCKMIERPICSYLFSIMCSRSCCRGRVCVSLVHNVPSDILFCIFINKSCLVVEMLFTNFLK